MCMANPAKAGLCFSRHMKMNRVRVYVDGFNLYHALLCLGSPHYRWLDLRKLAASFTHQHQDRIDAVFYCSAFADHLPNKSKAQRHRVYIAALQSTGVTFVEGKFKRKDYPCPLAACAGRPLHRHEEKETDVNVSIHLLRDALRGAADKYILISNDTDHLPTLRMIKREVPRAFLSVLTPPTYYPHKEMWLEAGQRDPKRITETHISQCLFPALVTMSDGTIIRRPTKYDPPT